MRLCAALAASALALCGMGAQAARFTGVVSQVIDGDTVWVRPDGGGPPRPVRIQGIDAPEICQPFGRKAREALAGQVRHRRVTVTTEGRDGHDRTLGTLHLQGRDVGEWMVSGGYAWSYRFKGDAGPYASQEAAARRARKGLWRQRDAMPPRDFRVRHGSCRRG